MSNGVMISVPGVFSKFVSSPFPRTEAMRVLAIFGGDAESSTMNLATGVNGTIIGAPTIVPASMLTSPQDGIDFGTTSQGPFTYAYVGVLAANTIFCGTARKADGTANPAADSLCRQSGANVSVGLHGSIRLTSSKLPSNGIRFIACTFDGATITLYEYDDDVPTIKSTPFASAQVVQANFRVGGDMNTTQFLTPTTAYAGAAYGAALTNAEIDQLYRALKAKLSARNVSIL